MVWVFVERQGDRVSKASREVLSEGRRLAERLSDELVALLIGYGVGSVTDEIGKYGADRTLVVEHPSLERYSLLPYCGVLARLVAESAPRILLFGATNTGNELAPRLAARMKLGLITDCDLLEVAGDGTLLASTSAYGDKFSATFRFCSNGMHMATLRPGAFEASLAHGQNRVEKAEGLEVGDEMLEIIGKAPADPNLMDLGEADVVVAGGRGMGSREGFERLAELARLIGASVGGTRVAVDSDWISYERQVGQTGKTVWPRFFMTLGTSGAIQYTAGFRGAEYVLAIDKDARAAIFDVADVGIVADVHELLPAVVAHLKKGCPPGQNQQVDGRHGRV